MTIGHIILYNKVSNDKKIPPDFKISKLFYKGEVDT